MSAGGKKTHWVRDIYISDWVREVYVSRWVHGTYMSDSRLVISVQVERRLIEFVTNIWVIKFVRCTWVVELVGYIWVTADLWHECRWKHSRAASQMATTNPGTLCTAALYHTATHCNTLQHTVLHLNTLQHAATHRTTLQRAATHCSMLQHTATHRNIHNIPQHFSCIAKMTPFLTSKRDQLSHLDMTSVCHQYDTNWIIETNPFVSWPPSLRVLAKKCGSNNYL